MISSEDRLPFRSQYLILDTSGGIDQFLESIKEEGLSQPMTKACLSAILQQMFEYLTEHKWVLDPSAFCVDVFSLPDTVHYTDDDFELVRAAARGLLLYCSNEAIYVPPKSNDVADIFFQLIGRDVMILRIVEPEVKHGV